MKPAGRPGAPPGALAALGEPNAELAGFQSVSGAANMALDLRFSSSKNLGLIWECVKMHVPGSNARDANAGSLEVGPATCTFMQS